MKKQLKKLTGKIDAVAVSVSNLSSKHGTSNLLIDQIREPDPTSNNIREYRFYTCSAEYTGTIREIGDDYVRIRLSSDNQGGHEDIFINMNSVCAVKETFSRE